MLEQRAGQAQKADTCNIMCMPAQIPHRNHFLYQPIRWTQNVWSQIVNAQGNENDVRRLFNLIPAIEAHIEDKIGLQLISSLVKDSSNILQDAFVKIYIDNWRTDNVVQYPSVLQQMCLAPPEPKPSFASNYYHILPHFTDFDTDLSDPIVTMSQQNPNQVSASTQSSNSNQQFAVDMIDLETLETLIQEQQQRDSSMISDQDIVDSISQTQNAVSASIHVFRVEMKRIFKTPEKTGETFKRFFIALKKVDPHAALRPVYSNDANRVPPISSPTQVQNPELIDTTKYHKSWTPNQRYGLSGQLLIETSFDFNTLSHHLYPWLNTAYYQMTLSECQTSELVTIGVFIRASYTLCRMDLTTSTKAIIASLDKELQFDFSFRADTWFFSGGKANVIFVAVARDRLKQGMDYFCNMYDGENKKVPDGHKLVFVPLYQIQLTPEMRERIGQEQRAWQDNEVACFVSGFRDLSTVLNLKDGSRCSLRSLILRLPNHPSSSRRAMFHGVDRRPESKEWIAVKYHRDDEAIFKQKAPSIAYDLAQLVIETDIPKIFVNPETGLDFGGEWRRNLSANTRTGRRVNPTPADPALLTHFQNVLAKLQPAVVKRPAITPDFPRYPQPATASMQTSYATRAASTTFTTSTTINNSRDPTTPNAHQTRTESVVVIEQYEARFVHVESRLTSVERSVNKSGTMLAKLLRHNGIAVDDEEDTDPASGPMEIETQAQSASGTKRICPTDQRELSQREFPNSSHA